MQNGKPTVAHNGQTCVRAQMSIHGWHSTVTTGASTDLLHFDK